VADQNDLIWTVNVLIDDKLMPAQIEHLFVRSSRVPSVVFVGA